MTAPASQADERHVLDFLHAHVRAIAGGDWGAYAATTSPELTLYEHFVTPHRQVGLDFHRFMIEHHWATGGPGRAHHVSVLEPMVQFLAGGAVAVVSYTLMVSVAGEAGVTHRSTNETRVLERWEDTWRVVHVHKSPAA